MKKIYHVYCVNIYIKHKKKFKKNQKKSVAVLSFTVIPFILLACFKAAQSQEAIDLEESVEKRLQDYKNRSRKLPLEGHEKFLDLTEKIAGILNPGMC